jgi:cell division septal protein FtsQ
MPGTPTQRMRASAKKVESAISSPRISEEEKERRKIVKEEKSNGVAPWIVGLLLFVVLGSSVVQIFFSIQSSPSMSDTN